MSLRDHVICDSDLHHFSHARRQFVSFFLREDFNVNDFAVIAMFQI